MSEEYSIGAIAHIRTDFPTKFGIPRQSGIVDGLRARIVFEPGFTNPDAVRGIEQFSHLWLIWRISAVPDGKHSLTVRRASEETKNSACSLRARRFARIRSDFPR